MRTSNSGGFYSGLGNFYTATLCIDIHEASRNSKKHVWSSHLHVTLVGGRSILFDTFVVQACTRAFAIQMAFSGWIKALHVPRFPLQWMGKPVRANLFE